jgi:serine protease Do
MCQGGFQRTLRTLCAAALLASLGLASPRAGAAAPPPGVAATVARLLPAVVTIQTVAMTPQGRMYFDGSGFIIESSGIIVTNRHVLAGADQIIVTVPGLLPLKGEPLFISEEIDIALLKVDAGRKLPTATLGNSDSVSVGDTVMLVGNALGVGQSLSVGVISALDRDIGDAHYNHFFQTDGALNHGNSGGPMFDLRGEVIAIDTGLTSSPGNTGSVGIGYAMPINDVKFVIDQYLRDRRVSWGTVGITSQRITEDLAVAFGLHSARGAIVTGVTEHSPASGKIREGDIILRIGAQDASDARAVSRLIAEAPPGQSLDIVLLRAGVEQTVSVTVATAESDPKKAMALLGRPQEESKAFATPSNPGMDLSAIDAAMRKKFRLAPGQQGVVVTSAEPKGVASKREIVAGDVIVSVDGQAVNTPSDVQQHLREVSDRHVPFAALLVVGERRTRWVALPLEADR